MASNFEQLLVKTKQQDQPQRLLFLFAKTSETKKSRKRDDKKGTIVPVMVVDKQPDDLDTFSGLINEADHVNSNWDFVFVASLSGDNNQAPSEEDAEPYLNQMAQDIMSGNNIMRYVVYDRNENPIELSAN